MGQRREAELHFSLGSLVVYSGETLRLKMEAELYFSLVRGTAGSQCEAVSHREHGGGSGGQFLAKITAGEEKRPRNYYDCAIPAI